MLITRAPPAERPSAVVVDRGVDQPGVGERDQGSVERPDAGAAEADLLHHAFDVTDLDPVADAKRSVEQDGDRTEQVLEQILRREGHREATQSQAGEQRRHVPPLLGEQEDDAEDGDRHLQRLRDERDQLVLEPVLGPGGACSKRRSEQIDLGECHPAERQQEQHENDHVQPGMDPGRQAEPLETQPPHPGHDQQSGRAQDATRTLKIEGLVAPVQRSAEQSVGDPDDDPVDQQADQNEDRQSQPLPGVENEAAGPKIGGNTIPEPGRRGHRRFLDSFDHRAVAQLLVQRRDRRDRLAREQPVPVLVRREHDRRGQVVAEHPPVQVAVAGYGGEVHELEPVDHVLQFTGQVPSLPRPHREREIPQIEAARRGLQIRTTVVGREGFEEDTHRFPWTRQRLVSRRLGKGEPGRGEECATREKTDPAQDGRGHGGDTLPTRAGTVKRGPPPPGC